MIMTFKINVAGFFSLKSFGWNVAKKKQNKKKLSEN
jgi:hypothetical protein